MAKITHTLKGFVGDGIEHLYERIFMNKKIGEPLTCDDLRKMYPGYAMQKSIDHVIHYFARQTDKFYLDPIEGTIHKLIEEENE